MQNTSPRIFCSRPENPDKAAVCSSMSQSNGPPLSTKRGGHSWAVIYVVGSFSGYMKVVSLLGSVVVSMPVSGPSSVGSCCVVCSGVSVGATVSPVVKKNHAPASNRRTPIESNTFFICDKDTRFPWSEVCVVSMCIMHTKQTFSLYDAKIWKMDQWKSFQKKNEIHCLSRSKLDSKRIWSDTKALLGIL